MSRNAAARQLDDSPLLAGLSEPAFDVSEPIPQEVQPIIEGLLDLTISGTGQEGAVPNVEIDGIEAAAEILTLRFIAVMRDMVNLIPASRRAKAYHDAVWTLKGND